jgi:hypothetical protein
MVKEVEDPIAWLLAGDPSLRWQASRDLVGADGGVVERQRRQVARAGWGARLLAQQDARGTWAWGQSSEGGLYNPKWTSTTYTLLLLRDLGLPPANARARRACRPLLDEGLQRDGGINYGWRGRSETCITGMVLSILAYFGIDDERLDRLTRYLFASDARRRLELPASGRRHPLVHAHHDQRARGTARPRAGGRPRRHPAPGGPAPWT